MKTQELEKLIVSILAEKPRLFDYVRVKDIKRLLTEHCQVTASEKMIVGVMLKLTNCQNPETEGFVCGDGSTLIFVDDHGCEGSKLRGIHHYGWYNLTL
jgi:hypothetical protein